MEAPTLEDRVRWLEKELDELKQELRTHLHPPTTLTVITAPPTVEPPCAHDWIIDTSGGRICQRCGQTLLPYQQPLFTVA